MIEEQKTAYHRRIASAFGNPGGRFVIWGGNTYIHMKGYDDTTCIPSRVYTDREPVDRKHGRRWSFQ